MVIHAAYIKICSMQKAIAISQAAYTFPKNYTFNKWALKVMKSAIIAKIQRILYREVQIFKRTIGVEIYKE